MKNGKLIVSKEKEFYSFGRIGYCSGGVLICEELNRKSLLFLFDGKIESPVSEKTPCVKNPTTDV